MLRDGSVDDETFRVLERELDLSESGGAQGGV
jgi:hypothetical protein